jgi:hypothetical protein
MYANVARTTGAVTEALIFASAFLSLPALNGAAEIQTRIKTY